MNVLLSFMELIHRLDDWFDSRLGDLDCSPDARAYIVGVLSRPTVETGSVVFAYAEARSGGSFQLYQKIGDSILWTTAFLSPNTPELESTIARLSYNACYRFTGKKWHVYEELADEFLPLARTLNEAFAGDSNLPFLPNFPH